MAERDHIGSFLEEEAQEERREMRQQLIRWAFGFALLFGGVFLAFWWSGAALRFGAARVADASAPSWRIWGVVRNAVTHDPIAWASVDDDTSGQPPFYHADASVDGAFSLLTLAEPHLVRFSAAGFSSRTIHVGRQWFIWWPSGQEHRDVELRPDF